MPVILELNDAEKIALVELLSRTIVHDRFPLSRRVKVLRVILARLQPPAPRRQPFPAPKPAGTPSLLLARKKGRRR
jgi:hypothetical protein